MGATPSTPATSSTSSDDRPFLERMLDPSGVLSATSTHPALLRHLNPNPDDAPPRVPAAAPSAATPSSSFSTAHDSHVSLSIDDRDHTASHSNQYANLDTIELHEDCAGGLEREAGGGEQAPGASDESYVDSALSLIAPPHVVALLASPAVSGEMQFVQEARRRHASSPRGGASTSTSRMTV